MQAEIETLREEMAAKEQVLSRQLRAAQQAALARLGRSPALVADAAAKGDKQAAQALVSQIRMQEATKIQQLKAVRAAVALRRAVLGSLRSCRLYTAPLTTCVSVWFGSVWFGSRHGSVRACRRTPA